MAWLSLGGSSLRHRVVLFSLIGTLVPIVLLGAIAYALSVSGMQQQARVLTEETLSSRKANIEQFLLRGKRLAVTIANSDFITELLTAERHGKRYSRIELLELNAELEKLLANDLRINDLLTVHLETKHHHLDIGEHNGHAPLNEAAIDDWFRECEQYERSICWPGIKENPQPQSIHGIIIPAVYKLNLFNEDTLSYEPVGFILLEYSIEALYEYTHHAATEHMYHMVVDEQCHILYHPSQSLISQKIQGLGPALKNQEVVRDFRINEESYELMMKGISGTQWTLIGAIPHNSFTRNARQVGLAALGFTLLALLLVFFTTNYIIRKLVYPIVTIAGHPEDQASVPQLQAEDYSIKEINRLVRWYQDYTSMVAREREQRAELATAYQNLQQAQDKLVESEKMASMGSLVAGVAHEINTPIGISITAMSHLADKTEAINQAVEQQQLKKQALVDYLHHQSEASQICLNNLQRAAQLVQTFKQVSADQHHEERREFSLHDCLEEIIFTVSPQFKAYQVEIKLDCPAQITLNSYPALLWQVFSNLIINSYRHGYEEDSTGVILIEARAQETGVMVNYRDDGKGIAAEHLNKIFDPFFTTKRHRGGTGLGLNIIYNLINQNLGGSIQCTSQLGEGSLFQVYLPYQAPVGKSDKADFAGEGI